MGAHDFGDHTVFTKADNESTEVSLAAMTPYMGRLVKFITIDEGDTHNE